MKKIYALVFAAFAITACQNETETTQQQTQQQEEASVITLTSSGSSTEFPDATLKSFTYDNGQFSYDYDATTYELGQQTADDRSKMCANSGKGQHIHFIVDDAPYKAFYTAAFENKMDDGEYHILSFLSRSYHESIKNGKAHLAQKVKFEGGKIASAEDIKEPMLFYSRPKGTYTGDDTKKLLLDFFIVNTELSEEGNQVKVTVNGEEVATVTEWKPYFLEGLPMGANTITLELVDAEGNTVEAPHNPVTREFDLMAEAPVE
ncbi:MAG: phosphopeptide-binding protein [Saprospiraceae bacterium]